MKKLNLILSSIFIAIELALLIAIQSTSNNNAIPILEYISIVLCFAFSIIFVRGKLNYLLSLGLFATVMADTFLVMVTPQQKLVGMIFFLTSQIFYCAYIISKTKNNKLNIINLAIRIVGSILVGILVYIVLKDKCDALSLISCIYLLNEILNLIFSFFTTSQNILFSIGFMLFLVCDIFIGLSVGNGAYITINATFASLISNGLLAWAFYIPSQTLIALQSTQAKTSEANNENS